MANGPSKFNTDDSFYLTHSGETCLACNKPMSHPGIQLPIGPAVLSAASRDLSNAAPMMQVPMTKVCYDCAITMLAAIPEGDAEQGSREGLWWRMWQDGKFEPTGLKENHHDTPGNNQNEQNVPRKQ
jgi:hypothetical protein